MHIVEAYILHQLGPNDLHHVWEMLKAAPLCISPALCPSHLELATMACVNPAHHDAVGLETVTTAVHVHVCAVCVIWISVACWSLRNIVVMFPALPGMMVWRACSAQLRAPVRNPLTHMYHIS